MSVKMHSLCENQAMIAGVNIKRGERIRGNHSAYDKGRTAHIKNGHVEQGMKHKSLFYNFL